jgi:tetratricopeptide (TPR) repeat protein
MLTCLLMLGATLAAGSPALQAHPPVVAGLEDLDKVIGCYPPNINSEQERKQVEQKYDTALTTLNDQLKTKPDDAGLLLKRACLQRLGSNLDRKGALEAAEKDLLTILKTKPKHEGALIELGTLYVNSNPQLAPKAEALFKRAQEAHGKDLLEPAQNGLFFAYYFQAHMKEALAQTELMAKAWPDNKQYPHLRELIQEVIDRAEKPKKPNE